MVHGFTCVTTVVSTARVLPYRASRCYKAGPGRRVTLLDPLVALGLAAAFSGPTGLSSVASLDDCARINEIYVVQRLGQLRQLVNVSSDDVHRRLWCNATAAFSSSNLLVLLRTFCPTFREFHGRALVVFNDSPMPLQESHPAVIMFKNNGSLP